MQRNLLKQTMLEMTWCEVDELAKKNALVLLPIGVVEEHSRHLPLGTDLYLALAQAEEIAIELKKCHFPCVIAPPFYWGIVSVVTQFFPGSFTSKEDTVIAALQDLLKSLENAGFTQVVAINAHGDPLHRSAIVKAFKNFNSSHKLKARWLTFQDDLKTEGFDGREDYVLPLPPYPFEKLIHCTQPLRDTFDVHAGAFETALMRDLFPELTDLETAQSLKPTLMEEAQIQKWCSSEPENKTVIPDGHAGDPAFSQYLTTNIPAANITMAHGIIDFYKNLNHL